MVHVKVALQPFMTRFGIVSPLHIVRDTKAHAANPSHVKKLSELIKLVTAPPPSTQPYISIAWNGSVSSAQFTVIGRGFLPNLPGTPMRAVAIRIVDAVSLTDQTGDITSSDGSGGVNYKTKSADLSALSIDALRKSRVAFSATDGRTDPASVPAGGPLWSNTVTVVISR
jgi:hypothetical protein